MEKPRAKFVKRYFEYLIRAPKGNFSMYRSINSFLYNNSGVLKNEFLLRFNSIPSFANSKLLNSFVYPL